LNPRHDNSWKFGWVNSYPRGKGGTRWNDRTCQSYSRGRTAGAGRLQPDAHTDTFFGRAR
jgi:hypothetical protein